MLSREHRRFLVVDQLIAAAVVNLLINYAVAWCIFRRIPSVGLHASPGIAGDTVVTAFLLPLITAFATAFVVRLRVVRGQLPPLVLAAANAPAWWRRAVWRRGTLLGVAAVLVLALPTVGLFALFGIEQLPLPRFLWFKAGFAAGVGLLVTPPLGWWALIDASGFARRDGASS
jgi:hypothetical protein